MSKGRERRGEEKEKPTLSGHSGPKRERFILAATSDVGSLGRKAKKEFEVPETKLYVRYVVSESLSTPPALARSLFLSLALFLSCSRFSLWHEDRRRVVAAGQTRGKCAA